MFFKVVGRTKVHVTHQAHRKTTERITQQKTGDCLDDPTKPHSKAEQASTVQTPAATQRQ